MSKLKAYTFSAMERIGLADYYLKSEADKVIAGLESKLDLYKRGFKEDDKTIAYLYAKLRQNKYKRCLAMAGWCSAELGALVSTWESKKVKHYKKWYKRWMELAEKIKEAKNAED